MSQHAVSFWGAIAVLAMFGASASAAPEPVRGRVTDPLGRPIANVIIYSVDERNRLSGRTRADREGRFEMTLPPGKHLFGVASPRFKVLVFEHDARHIGIVLGAQAVDLSPPDFAPENEVAALDFASPLPASKPALPSAGEIAPELSLGVVSGRVIDETGVPLAGVRVFAVASAGEGVPAVAFTNAEGRFWLAASEGKYRVLVRAMGLKIARIERPTTTTLEVTLAIDAQPQYVRTYDGRVVKFQIDNTIWPEYLPPVELRGILYWYYGVHPNAFARCPSGFSSGATAMPNSMRDGRHQEWVCPISRWVYLGGLKKFWWLRLLESPAPNPLVRPDVEAFGHPGASPPRVRPREH